MCAQLCYGVDVNYPYGNLVPLPIDFSRIHRRLLVWYRVSEFPVKDTSFYDWRAWLLQTGFYRSVDALRSDIQLVHRNCEVYNSAES